MNPLTGRGVTCAHYKGNLDEPIHWSQTNTRKMTRKMLNFWDAGSELDPWFWHEGSLYHSLSINFIIIVFNHNILASVQSLSHVWLFAIPWTAACQASLSISNFQSPFKLMSIALVMPSNHLILCHPLLLCFQPFPVSGSFPMSQFFPSGGQGIGVSTSTSVLPMNIQD